MKKRRIIIHPTHTPLNSCRALVLVDSSRLKALEQEKCRKLYQRLESARALVELHESKSVPEYRNWMHTQFGKRLAEVRALDDKLIELRNLVESVYDESHYTGCPPWEAYESIMRLRTEIEEMQRKADSTDQDSDSGSDSGFNYEFDFDSQSRAEAEEEFKEECRHSTEGYEEETAVPDPAPSTEEIERDSRVKGLYRMLARKLHPDLNPGLEPKMIALWHQVQHAYETQDLLRLETLSAVSEMHDQSWEKIDGISVLRNLFGELKKALRHLEKKMRLARKEISWGFYDKMHDSQEMMAFRQMINAELKSEESEKRNVLQELEALIQSWAKPTKKARRQKRPTLRRDEILHEFR